MKTKALAVPFLFEVKAEAEPGVFSGYGSVFGVRDSYGDVVEPGAFLSSLGTHASKGTMPAMLWQHRSAEPLGVWTKMAEDEKGLAVEGRLALKTQRGAEAYELLRMGAIRGLSIGYAPVVEEWDKGTQTNRLKQADLWEVSPVTFPANPEAQVEAVRAAIENPRDFEHQLRDVLGLTQAQAKRLMAGGFKALATRDVAEDALVDAVKAQLKDYVRFVCKR